MDDKSENSKSQHGKSQKASLPPAVLRTLGACEYLSVSRSHLYVLRNAGEITPIKLGRRAIGYLRAELDAYLARCT